MIMAERLELTESPEAELLREIENLIRRLTTGKASSGDLQRLQELQKLRVQMMRPRKRARV